MRFLAIFLFLSIQILAQVDLYKWKTAENEYILKPDILIIDDIESKNIDSNKNIFISFYKIFISNIDGDNCPFHPSCSSFFSEAVEQVGIIEGTLLFSDRLTRDTNLFKDIKKYGKYHNHKLADPLKKYISHQETSRN